MADNSEGERRTLDVIRKYARRIDIIKYIQSRIKSIPRKGSIKLIELILSNKPSIRLDEFLDKQIRFRQYNMSNIYLNDKDKKYYLKEDFIQKLKNELDNTIGKKVVRIDDNIHMDDKEQPYCKLNKHFTYNDVRKFICEELTSVDFRYDFDDPDMKGSTIKNTEKLQRCKIQILGNPIKFDYPAQYVYNCPECNNTTYKNANEVESTNGRISCPNMREYIRQNGETGFKECRTKLSPDTEISQTIDCYYYTISYEDEEKYKHTVGAISFKNLEPGFFDAVLFKIKQPKNIELYQIMDVKKMESFEADIPENSEDENYLFRLQRSMDDFIYKQTGMRIHGLLPIKIAFVMQTIINNLGFKLNANIQIVGDPSTGKSTILKYYGFLLNNYMNLNTNGLSVSVPGLRGTREVINLMGKEQKVITQGYLGVYKTINIDEAGENPVLIQNLKTFLFEDNYGYDKAGGSGVFQKRTAHVNLSENLNNNHLGQYRGSIRKAYKEFNEKIGDEEKEPWDESWDLHLPIFRYNHNPYLKKVIKQKRDEYKNSQVFWIDGHDYALHERFPFYFYLVSEGTDEALNDVIKNNIKNDTISENFDLIRVLRTDTYENLFKKMKMYKYSESDNDAYFKVDEILDEYGIHADVRMKEFYYRLVSISRIANFRKNITEQDLNILRWFLENTNCKIDVRDTVEYKINGAPKKEDEKKEEGRQDKQNGFGIAEKGVFDEL